MMVKRLSIGYGLLAIVVGVATAFLMSPPQFRSDLGARSAQDRVNGDDQLRQQGDASTKIRNSVAAVSRSVPAAAPLRASDLAVAAFLSSTNLARTYAELSKLTTPEARFVSAHIQDLCSRVDEVEKLGVDHADPRARPILGADSLDLRQHAQLRLRERSSRLLCAGFPKDLLSEGSVKSAMERAAAAGDVRAKLRVLETKLIDDRSVVNVAGMPKQAEMVGDVTMGIGSKLSVDDFSLLRSAFETRDPIAIRAAGPLLAGLYSESEVSFGPLSSPIDGIVGDSVWRILGCQYGGGCDASSSDLSEACVLAARCDSVDIKDYIVRYDLRPEQVADVLALVDRFQRGIDQGDWSFLELKAAQFAKFDRTPFPPRPRPFILHP